MDSFEDGLQIVDKSKELGSDNLTCCFPVALVFALSRFTVAMLESDCWLIVAVLVLLGVWEGDLAIPALVDETAIF